MWWWFFSYYTFLESAHINIINVQMMTDFLCKLKYTTKVASSIARVDQDHHRPLFLTLCSLTPASMLSAELQQSNFVSFFFGRAINPKLIAEKRNKWHIYRSRLVQYLPMFSKITSTALTVDSNSYLLSFLWNLERTFSTPLLQIATQSQPLARRVIL